MKGKILPVFITVFLVLAGCQGMGNNNNTDNTEESQRGTGEPFERTRTNHQTNDDNMLTPRFVDDINDRNRDSNNRASNNRQDRYEVSEEAAERIVDEIPEIDQAYVLTTRHNAYVAATLDKENATKRDNLAYNDRQNSSAGMNVRNVNDRNVRDRTVNKGDSNKRRTDNHMANRKETPSTHIGNKRDAESDEVSDQVKNEIADIVQEVDEDIENVYVSTSPDFFNLTENYVNDMQDGKPVRGFFDQIGNTIERIFPQNKG